MYQQNKQTKERCEKIKSCFVRISLLKNISSLFYFVCIENCFFQSEKRESSITFDSHNLLAFLSVANQRISRNNKMNSVFSLVFIFLTQYNILHKPFLCGKRN